MMFTKMLQVIRSRIFWQRTLDYTIGVLTGMWLVERHHDAAPYVLPLALLTCLIASAVLYAFSERAKRGIS